MVSATPTLKTSLVGDPKPVAAAPVRMAVVVPCYRERAHVLDVLRRVPERIDSIICVDDGCPDQTGAFVEAENTDPRVKVLFNDSNEGVGGAVITGYRRALEDGATIVIKLDGDGQMDPDFIDTLVAPICNGSADYSKGNRFFDLERLYSMPRGRVVGNAALSFISKFSTGYWQTFDPTNGFTAIHRSVLELLPLDKIDRGYFFESDMLFRLNTLRSVVVDVPMFARYGEENSHLSIGRELVAFAGKHVTRFFKRIFYNYFLRGFSLASIQWVLGPLLVLFGVGYGLEEWIESSRLQVTASAGTVMLAALPTIIGIQFILAAIDYDIRSVPTVPLHRLLSGDR
ncbi:MAG: glycosyltransferase family 2 protein [Gammaproteobacteria bacterium]|nr:glycosyltransferase family 2 protein [Gammaproteobacteria bacterium]NNL99581.1 glycosyltransferase family 2 protein [Gammaproteobacteria bacterium]